MKTQFVITNADPIFLAALMETMAAMQAEKDQGDETESFVARFPDLESVDLEWIKATAHAILVERSGADEAAAGAFDAVYKKRRFFRNPEGDEWSVPGNGDKGVMRDRDSNLWVPSVSALKDFVDPATGAATGRYVEFFPDVRQQADQSDSAKTEVEMI